MSPSRNGPGRGCAAAHRPCAPSPRYPRPPPRRVSRMPSWTSMRREEAGFIEDAETSAPRYALELHRRHLPAPPTRVKNQLLPDRRHLSHPGDRGMHGVAEGIPGVTVDKYGSTLFVQSWRNPVVRARLLYPHVRNSIRRRHRRYLTLGLNHHHSRFNHPTRYIKRGELLELCDAVRADGTDGIGAVDRVAPPAEHHALRWNDDDRQAFQPTTRNRPRGSSLRPRRGDVRRAEAVVRGQAPGRRRVGVRPRSSGSGTGSSRRADSAIEPLSTLGDVEDPSTDTVDEEPR